MFSKRLLHRVFRTTVAVLAFVASDLVSLQALAVQPCIALDDKHASSDSSLNKQRIETALSMLRTLAGDVESEFDKLQVYSTIIKEVREDVTAKLNPAASNLTSGWYNIGVFSVVVEGQPSQVLKVSNVRKSGYSGDKIAVLMQKVLGELGAAPKISGILSNASITRMKGKLSPRSEKFREQYNKSDEHYGILMEQIVDGWNITKDEQRPAWAEKLDEADIIKQVRSLFKLLGKLHIAAGDSQFLISPAGKVYLIDIEFYKFEPTWSIDAANANEEDFSLARIRQKLKK